MIINSIKYGNQERTFLIVNDRISLKYPSKTWMDFFIKEWFDAGNVIANPDPLPDPPTNDELITMAGPIMVAFLKAYAKREGVTIRQVRDAIIAEL